MSDAYNDSWALERLERWRAQRDGEALGELIKWQRDRAYAIARRMLSSGADAEDAVQQAFTKLLSRTEGFGNAEEFKLAVYRAVMQCALDLARANRARNSLEKAMSQFERSPAPLPAHAAEQAEVLGLVSAELQRLPEQDRALVVLCCQEGLSVSEAAQILAAPRETLRDRLASSLEQLRRNVKQRGVALSLLLLVGVLQQGSAEAAPAGLCAALDSALPGAPCAALPAAAAAKVTPAGLLASAGVAAVTLSAKAMLFSAAMLALALAGGAVWYHAQSAAVHPALATAARQPEQARSAGAQSTTGAAEQPVRPEGSRVVPPQAVPQAAPGKPAVPVAQAPATQTPAPGAAAGRAVVVAKKGRKADQAAKAALAQLPAAIRAAAEQAVQGIVLTEAERKTKGQAVLYEIKGEVGDKEFDITVNAEGKVLEVQEDLDDDGDNEDGDNGRGEVKPQPKKAEAPAGEF